MPRRILCRERPVIKKLLLVALVLVAGPAWAQAQEPRVWDAGAGAWTDLDRLADALARHDPATHRLEAALLEAVGRRAVPRLAPH
jgi:hypothetical protein